MAISIETLQNYSEFSSPADVLSPREEMESENRKGVESYGDLFDNDGYRSTLFTMISSLEGEKLPCPKEIADIKETSPEIYGSIRNHFTTLLQEKCKINPLISDYVTKVTKNLSTVINQEDSPHKSYKGKETLKQCDLTGRYATQGQEYALPVFED